MYEKLESRLKKDAANKDFVKKILCLDSVDSTNNYALSMETKSEGLFIISKSQTKGKGRNNRYWHSLEGKSIALSGIVKYPESPKLPPTLVPLLSSNAVVDTLIKFGLNPKVKWPNDVLVNSKKISGILCESDYKKDSNNFIIVGIGINVNLTNEDFAEDKISYVVPPTSMNIETNGNHNLEDVAFNLIDSFCFWINEYKNRNIDRILKFWEENWNDKNKEVSLIRNEKLLKGIAKRVTNKGELVLQYKDKEEIISSGEIKV
tara:strand:- start:374 stop:1159 length:786 start_codon:yes stop_codon:yes gene_type:complete